MDTYLQKLKTRLKDTAFNFSLSRLEDIDFSKEDYRDFFKTLSDYCFLVDSQETLSGLFSLAEKEELTFSGVFSSEELVSVLVN